MQFSQRNIRKGNLHAFRIDRLGQLEEKEKFASCQLELARLTHDPSDSATDQEYVPCSASSIHGKIETRE
jgi:hypothetical protein